MKSFQHSPPKIRLNYIHIIKNVVLPSIPAGVICLLYAKADQIYISEIQISIPRIIFCHGSLLFTILWLCNSQIRLRCEKNPISTIAFYFVPPTVLCGLVFAQWHFAVSITLICLILFLLLIFFCWNLKLLHKPMRQTIAPCIRLTVCLCCAVFIVPSCISIYSYDLCSPTYKMRQEVYAELFSQNKVSTPGAADPFEDSENLELLRKFQPSHWNTLDTNEKVTLAQEFIFFECQDRFRIDGVPPLVVAEKLNVLGVFHAQTNEIHIDLKLLETAEPSEILTTLAHESHHYYVKSILELTDWDSEIAKTMFYDEVLLWRENAMHYSQPNDDWESYHGQVLEVSAREYSTQEVAKIQSYWG